MNVEIIYIYIYLLIARRPAVFYSFFLFTIKKNMTVCTSMYRKDVSNQ
jgi:hypothetical protein